MEIPEIGQVYERYNTRQSVWTLETRKVLDVTDSAVFYEVIFAPTEGTCVESEPVSKQASFRDWWEWAKIARLISV